MHSWSGGGVDIPRTGLRAGVAQLSSGAASSRPGAGLPATLLNTTNLSEPLGNLEWGTLVRGEEELGLCLSREWVEFALSELASCMSWRLEVGLAGEGEGKERAPLE